MKGIKISKISIKTYCELMASGAYLIGAFNALVVLFFDLANYVMRSAEANMLMEQFGGHVLALIYLPIESAIGGFIAGIFTYPLIKYALKKKGSVQLSDIEYEILGEHENI